MKVRRIFVYFLLMILAGLWIFNVSRPGRRVEGCLSGCSQTEGEWNGELQVLSFNMLHGFPKFEHLQSRLDLIAAEIDRLDADIVLLQEVPWTLKTRSAAKYLAAQTGMNYAYLRANGNRWTIFFEEGEAILSRYPLQNPEFVVLQPKARFYENRVALHANAITPKGEIDLFVTHLSHRDPQLNAQQAASLKVFVEENQGPFTVIGGDFNSPPESLQIQNFQGQWQDVFGALHPDVRGFTCCTDNLTDKSIPHDLRIDYIFLIGLGDITEASSQRVFAQPFKSEDGWLWASDHMGVMAILPLP